MGLPLACRSASCASESEVLAGEELAGNSPTAATTRRSDGGGFWQENKVTRMKHDHQKSKLGFPFGSDTM